MTGPIIPSQRDNGQVAEYELVTKLHGLLGGLIEQTEQSPVISLQSGWAETGRAPGSCENAIVPTHCLRTVSQRSLSTPNTFLSLQNHIPAGVNVFDALITNAVTGALPGVALGGTAPIIFNSANIQAQRQRVDELVLIGARAKVSLQLQAGDGGPVVPFNQGNYKEAVEDFIRQYVVFRIYHTADQNEPWVSDTPLKYVDRPDGEFLAMPPVLWKDRDPRMELDVRVADFGAGAGQLPVLSNTAVDLDAQCTILFETLWIPSPDHCGNYGPGSMCPKTHVANAPGYVGR
jgi:hypothetical protein